MAVYFMDLAHGRKGGWRDAKGGRRRGAGGCADQGSHQGTKQYLVSILDRLKKRS